MVEKEKSSRRWSMAPGVARRPAAMPEPAKDGAGGGGAEEAVAGVEDDFAVGAEDDEQVARVEVGLVESGGEVAADEGGDGRDGEDGGVGGMARRPSPWAVCGGKCRQWGRKGAWAHGGRVDAPEERGHGGVAGDGESRGWRCAVVELVDELVDGGGDGLLELCSAVGGGRRGRCAR